MLHFEVTEDQFVEAIMQREGLTPKCQQVHKEGISRMTRGRSLIQQVFVFLIHRKQARTQVIFFKTYGKPRLDESTLT